MVETQWWRKLHVSEWSNAVTPDCTSSRCVPNSTKKSFTEEHFWWTLKNISITKKLISLNLSSWANVFLNILSDETGIMHKALLPACQIYSGFEEKHLCDWVVSCPSCFFHGRLFLLERTVEKLWLFRVGYVFGRHFSQKWTKWSFKESSEETDSICCQW